MIGTLHIVVAMKPLDGNFISNAKKYGVAGLNIDGARIAGPKGDGVWGTSNKTINTDRKFNASPGMEEYRSEAHSAGRWPPNVILSHLGACRCLGVKKVRGIKGGTGNHDGIIYGARWNQGEPVKDYADADGKKTVEAWECAPGCPVAAFPSGGAVGRASGPTRGKLGTQGRFGPANGDRESKFYGDTGSAARFFKQVKGDSSITQG